MNKNIQISLRLKEFCDKNFEGPSAFARALSISPQNLYQYMSGKSAPGAIIQDRLRDLGCDIEWLMTGKTSVEYKAQRENSEAAYWKEQALKYKGEMDAVRRSLSAQVIRVILESTPKTDAHGGKGKKKLPSKSTDDEVPQ